MKFYVQIKGDMKVMHKFQFSLAPTGVSLEGTIGLLSVHLSAKTWSCDISKSIEGRLMKFHVCMDLLIVCCIKIPTCIINNRLLNFCQKHGPFFCFKYMFSVKQLLSSYPVYQNYSIYTIYLAQIIDMGSHR